MSHKELCRVEIIQKLVERRFTEKDAATLLHISVRQIRRLKRAYNDHGPEGLITQKRGRPGNHKLPDSIKVLSLSLIKANYADFRPTFAAEKLLDNHGISVSRETLRHWMIEADLWVPRDKRLARAYQPRYRRDCLGELVQIDGSDHAWFEDRAPKCTLLVYIDDATSRLMELRFVKSESTFTYFESTNSYLNNHGKPVAFYSDKHSTFRTNKKGEMGGDGVTQFGRALTELNIDIICANSSQAKGRVERANRTLQDRLVKELRLQKISTIEEANDYLPEFMEHYNQQFSKPPRNDRDLHRELMPHDDLKEIFCWQEPRTLSNSLTVQYDRIIYMIKDSVETRKLARKRVTVYDYPDGSIKIKYQGKELPSSIFDQLQRVDQASIVNNKRLGTVLSFIKDKQDERDEKRSTSTPSRRHIGMESTTTLRKSTVARRQRAI